MDKFQLADRYVCGCNECKKWLKNKKPRSPLKKLSMPLI